MINLVRVFSLLVRRHHTDYYTAKLGVNTKELDDGLEIYGKPIGELREGCSIHCYDDHRVAMAFSVLGSVVKGTIIEEKRCVEKTWPNWWDDLENKVYIRLLYWSLYNLIK